ncbi:MAG: MoaD/ThiS family protein [Planctomycetota bacterium]|jgi:sulfur carrier protein
MTVEVRLFATFREGRFDNKQIDLADESPLGDVLQRLKIPKAQVGILLVNGRSASPETKLKVDDVISIFPALGGG